MTDVIVVGAGVVGASIAFHLAEQGVNTLLVDREGPASGPTARSGSLIRAHYPTALEGDLAWESPHRVLRAVGRAGGRRVRLHAHGVCPCNRRRERASSGSQRSYVKGRR